MHDPAANPRQHLAEPPDVEETRGRIGARRAHQEVIRFVLP